MNCPTCYSPMLKRYGPITGRHGIRYSRWCCDHEPGHGDVIEIVEQFINTGAIDRLVIKGLVEV